MLSASIQSSLGPTATDTTAVAKNPAPVQSGLSIAEKNSLAEVQGNLFSGRLNESLGEVVVDGEFALTEFTGEQPTTELSAELPEYNTGKQTGQEQQNQDDQPNAEEWLQAMLAQQELQLQTRDSVDVVAEVPAAIVNSSMPVVKAVTSTAISSADKDAPLSPEINSRSHTDKMAAPVSARPAAGLASNIAIAQEAVKSVSLSSPERSVEPIAKKLSSNVATIAPTVVPAHQLSQARVAEATFSASSANSTSSSFQLAAAVLTETAVSEPAAFNAAPSTLTNATESAPRVQSQLTLQAPEAKWGEQLLHALRDNVQVQIQQKIQNATIRLDPPELGSLEIFLSHESGRLTVQITSSQADVARLIQATSERLRQELSGPQFTQVNVQTSTDGQSGQQQSRERQRFINDEMILANDQEFVGNDPATKRSSDVLVTA